MTRLRRGVFFPPFFLVVTALIISVLFPSGFLEKVVSLKEGMLDVFGGVFVWVGFLLLILAAFIFVSPLGRVKIGGRDAEPLVSRGAWLAIALCTNTAVGVLFWAMAEPLYHFLTPPASLQIVPEGQAATTFALSSLFMHWSFIPCTLYALPGLMFAICIYNFRQPFSLASCFYPMLGAVRSKAIGTPVDAVCLYALVAGMAAALATGILTIAGGLEHIFGLDSGPFSWTLIGIAIVGAFTASAVSGLQRGIRILSGINTGFFFLLILFFLIAGPTALAISLGVDAFRDFFVEFIPRATLSAFAPDDPWPGSWTIFYWAVWFAWAPVTSVFLGKISRGYSVRSYIVTNILVPATFAIIWMWVLGGTAMCMQTSGAGDFTGALDPGGTGPESIAFLVLDKLPGATVVIPFFLLVVFIAFVTAADSNTTAMASMSTDGLASEETDAPIRTKLIWGVTVGGLALSMLWLSGIEGIKNISYLGGLPALFFEIAIAVSFIFLLVRRKRLGLGMRENDTA